MLPPDDESTPPVNSFGAQRSLVRELARIRGAVALTASSVRVLTRAVVIEAVLLGVLAALWAITLASR